MTPHQKDRSAKLAEYRTAGKRGGKSTAAIFSWNIEGQSVTVDEIAARLGMSDSATRKRVLREQASPGPVTWAGLALSNADARARG